jgi:type VI secretion system VasD/TssJ family lipoprotein
MDGGAHDSSHEGDMRTLPSLLLALVLATAGGCGPLRQKPSVTVSVQADSRMNFVNDRPNAAVVRVYELTSRANFDRASRAALWRDDSAALGGELISKRELTLLPDAHESLKIGLKKPTRFVAVAADYYDPQGEGWRAVYPAKSSKKPIHVRLGERQLSVR